MKPDQIKRLRSAILTGGDIAVHLGRYPCPRCGSKATGTETVATSSRWMTFLCSDCLHRFRKSSAHVSSLSGYLRRLSSALAGRHDRS